MSLVIPEQRLVPAWLAALKHLKVQGGAATNVVLDIADAATITDADRLVLGKVDDALRIHADTSVKTVAATIFPQAIYARYGDQGRQVFYAEFLRRMKKAKKHGTWGTYAMRLMEYEGSSATVQPLESVVTKLIKASSGGHPYKSNYELSVHQREDSVDPGEIAACEVPIYDQASDGAKIGNIPCLSHVTVKMTPDHKVALTAIYRSHYYCNRALGNLVGLAQLQGFIAKETDLARGPLTCISTYAVLDHKAWGGVRAGKVLQQEIGGG